MHPNIISQDEARVAELCRSARRVAVLGIKTEAQAAQPGFYVPKALHDGGVEIVPVPVYYPDVTEILGARGQGCAVDECASGAYCCDF